jgi:hypothetical protein
MLEPTVFTVPLPLPYIDDYVATTCRHPSFEIGYRQWLACVKAWGHNIAECDPFTHQPVWTREYYQNLIDVHNDDPMM